MKQLLILLLFPIAGLGQSDAVKYKLNHKPDKKIIDIVNSSYSALAGLKISPLPNPVMDTARVFMLCADTSIMGEGRWKYRSPHVFWQFGYKVFEKRLRQYYSVIENGVFVDKPGYDLIHLAYLDSRMKPLLKSIVVIITIKL